MRYKWSRDVHACKDIDIRLGYAICSTTIDIIANVRYCDIDLTHICAHMLLRPFKRHLLISGYLSHTHAIRCVPYQITRCR